MVVLIVAPPTASPTATGTFDALLKYPRSKHYLCDICTLAYTVPFNSAFSSLLKRSCDLGLPVTLNCDLISFLTFFT